MQWCPVMWPHRVSQCGRGRGSAGRAERGSTDLGVGGEGVGARLLGWLQTQGRGGTRCRGLCPHQTPCRGPVPHPSFDPAWPPALRHYPYLVKETRGLSVLGHPSKWQR